MNLILLDDHVDACLWGPGDHRARHIRKVLRASVGDELHVGAVDGPRGKATIRQDDADGIRVSIEWGSLPPPPSPLRLVVGLPRPQAARRILRESVSMGIEGIDFFRSDRGELSYSTSHLWTTDEWQRHLRESAELAFTTHLPEVTHAGELSECLGLKASACACKIGLDVYEAGESLSRMAVHGDSVALAVGSERGWSTRELTCLRESGFSLAHLGERVLRTDTACLASASIVSARMGWL